MTGGRDGADPPRGVEAGDRPGEEREGDGGEDHGHVELEERHPLRPVAVDAVEDGEAGEREQHPQQAAGEPHQLALHEMLDEDRPAARSQRPAHPHVGGAGEELAEEEADQVERRHHQEEQGDDRQRLGLRRHHLAARPSGRAGGSPGC